jgi:hypothetical protein
MRKGMLLAPTILSALLLLSLAGVPAAALRDTQVVIAVDLSHQQPTEGLDVIVGSCPECYWVLILLDEAQREAVEPGILQLFDETRTGGITSANLGDVDILLIGQPQTPLTEDEISAISSWFSEGGKALWIAGDSDYPAGGNEIAQLAVNQVLEAIGSVIRMDFVSVEDPVANAGAVYRVTGIIDPSEPLAQYIMPGIEHGRVLFHGPGALYILVDGEPVNPARQPEALPPNVFIIVRSTDQSYVVEHQTDPAQGQNPAVFYDPLNDEVNTGPFPLMMAEVFDNNRIVIASSESMYDGYEPMTAASYYEVPLDGPVFVPNVIKLMIGIVRGEITLMPAPPAETVTVTETVTETETVFRTTTATMVETTTETVTEVKTEVSTTTQLETTTVVEQTTNWGITIGLFILGLIIGAAALYLARS